MTFVEAQLQSGTQSARDPNFFWGRSQELQQTELAHADIRKGLEAAGF
jgi:son of sevenless